MRLTFKYCLLSLTLVLGLSVVLDAVAHNKIYITNNSSQSITVKLRYQADWGTKHSFTPATFIPDGQTRVFEFNTSNKHPTAEFCIKRSNEGGFEHDGVFNYVLSIDGVWTWEYASTSADHACHGLNDGKLSNNCRGSSTSNRCKDS